MGQNRTVARCGRAFSIALVLACLAGSTARADDIDHTTSARKGDACSPCVLILFLYDLNKQWHVIRAATYKSLEACKEEGTRVKTDMTRQIDKKPQATTSFYCLREGL